MENSMKLIMLGTGNAATVACYNTCFALCREDKYFLEEFYKLKYCSTVVYMVPRA